MKIPNVPGKYELGGVTIVVTKDDIWIDFVNEAVPSYQRNVQPRQTESALGKAKHVVKDINALLWGD